MKLQLRSVALMGLFFLLLSAWNANSAKAQVLSLDVPNYSDCPIDIEIRVNCAGRIGVYRGTLAPGGLSGASINSIRFVMGTAPAAPCDINSCDITMILTTPVSSTSMTAPAGNFEIDYCCNSNGCSGSNNCTALKWDINNCEFVAAPWYCS